MSTGQRDVVGKGDALYLGSIVKGWTFPARQRSTTHASRMKTMLQVLLDCAMAVAFLALSCAAILTLAVLAPLPLRLPINERGGRMLA